MWASLLTLGHKLAELGCRDTEALDSSLGNTVSMFVTCLASVMGSIAVVLVVTPAVLFAVIPLAIVYRQVQVPPPSRHL